jgi:hypothetical protein
MVHVWKNLFCQTFGQSRLPLRRRVSRGGSPGSGVQQLEQRTLLTTIVVHEGQSIQEAIDAADPGDVVAIKPGVYFEQLTINKDLTLRGLTLNPERVVITPGDVDGAGITVRDNGMQDVQQVTIENLRVTGWAADGIITGDDTGVDEVASVEIRNVIADNNGDDGVDLNNPSFAHLFTVYSHNNFDDGFDVQDGQGEVIVEYSQFAHNDSDGVEIINFDGLVGVDHVYASNNFFEGLLVFGFTDGGGNGGGEENGFTQTNGGGFGQTDVAVLHSRFTENGDDGADLNDVGNVFFHGVYAKDNFGDGLDIDVAFGDVFINSSSFRYNGEDGLDLNDIFGLTLIVDVYSSHNAGDGLSIAFAGPVEIANSKFLHNGDDGIDLEFVDSFSAKKVLARGNGDSDIEQDNMLFV